MGDAVALNEDLVCRWPESTEGTHQLGSCLSVGNRGSYGQQKEGVDWTAISCTTTMS